MTLHPPVGFAEACAAFVLRWALKLLLKPVFSPRFSIGFQRRWLGWVSRTTLVPRGVVFEPADLAVPGEPGPLPGLWVRRSDTLRQAGPALAAGGFAQARPAPAGVILYLHGGAYCIGSSNTHRAITGALCMATGLPVFVLDYRLAPEHPYPAGLDDAVRAYRVLAAHGPVVIAGDSAGGGLALATALALRVQAAGMPLRAQDANLSSRAQDANLTSRAQDANLSLQEQIAILPAPAGLVLFSPWADLTPVDGPVVESEGEAMLSVAWADTCAAHYVGSATSAAAAAASPAGQLAATLQRRALPLVSPLKADLRGMPPTLIQAGTDELLHGQALQLHAALQAAGVASQCQITPKRWHVFQSHVGVLASADQAIARAAQFILPAVATAAGTAKSATTAEATAATATATGSTTTAAGQSSIAPPTQHEVVILGAGMSGLCMAIKLKRSGMHNFVILEKQPGLGGTWWDNTYPGAHVDVPAPVYSFSFAANPRWKRRFASSSEIQAYMQRLAQSHGLLAHLRLGTRLASAEFDAASGNWRFATDQGERLEAKFFVCSTGPLSQPRWPEVAGLDSFAGQRLHSARWDHRQQLAGKRVAVIGTGSTAAQLIPPIAAQAAHLAVFQRTANWVLPRLDRRYFWFDRLLARFPPYAAAVRWSWMHILELGRRGFEEGSLARRAMLKAAAMHLHRQVPDTALAAQLTPNYPLGCKRIMYSNDFYTALVRPNTTLVTQAIERITPDSIVTADGTVHPIDVLVCATGFDTLNLLSSVRVSGVAGRTLAEAWGRAPEAFHGTSVAGFPNMFLMLGPNTATGHTSTLLFIEPAADHAIACMQAVRSGGHRSIQVRPDVMAEHNRLLQSRLKGSVWSQCRSWYRAEDGRVVALFPGYTREYVNAVRKPRFDDYLLV